MRATLSLVVLLLASACGGGEDAAPVAEETAMQPAATTTLADFYGTWEAMTMLEGTPEPIPVTLIGSEDGWTMNLPDRDGVILHASVSGDTLRTESEPYESILREGVTVHTRTAVVLRDGRMVGTVEAIYTTPDGEQVVSGTMEGGTRVGGM